MLTLVEFIEEYCDFEVTPVQRQIMKELEQHPARQCVLGRQYGKTTLRKLITEYHLKLNGLIEQNKTK